MKKILFLLAMLMMIVNVSFAMTGVIDQQTINGVHAGMTAEEVVSKWGQPIAQEGRNDFYFNPGGLLGHFYTTPNNVALITSIRAKYNPKIVLNPSGVAIGMSREETERRLGKPDKIGYMQWLDNSSGMTNAWYYRGPRFTRPDGREDYQLITIHVGVDENHPNYNKVLAIWLSV